MSYEELPGKPAHYGGPGCGFVAVAPDGRKIVTADSRLIQIRSATDGRIHRQIELDARLRGIAVSPDSRWLLAGDQKPSASIFDMETGERLHRNTELDDWVVAVAWLDATRFAAVSSKGLVLIADARTGATERTWPFHEESGNSVNALGVIQGGRSILLSVGGDVVRYELDTGVASWRFELGWGNARALGVAPSGLRAALHYMVKDEEGILFLETQRGTVGPRYAFGTPEGIRWPELGPSSFIRMFPEPAYSPDGRVCATNTPIGTLVVIDSENGQALLTPPRAAALGWISALAWFADGNHLVVGCGDNQCAIWRMRPLGCVLAGPFKEGAPAES